ncbi:MAG: DUF1707 domain-containing protein [Arachnia sp.]
MSAHSQSEFGHLRCSDADRDLVVDVLNTAYADGRLSLAEHDERANAAYKAKTFGELDLLTTDLVTSLPGTTPPPRVNDAQLSPAVQPAVGAPATNQPALNEVRTFLGTARRSGLHLPESVSLGALMGEIRLDLVDATFAARDIYLNVSSLMAEIRIRVPAGVIVEDQVTSVIGETSITGISAESATVTLHLRGTSVMSQISVLGPEGRPRKYERFVR